jgi:large subunit ribosomal protein L30
MGLKEINETVASILQSVLGSGGDDEQDAQGNGGGTIRIQYYKSFIGAPQNQRQVVRSLGITKLNQIVERPDTPSTRGAVAKVPHLLRIVE